MEKCRLLLLSIAKSICKGQTENSACNTEKSTGATSAENTKI